MISKTLEEESKERNKTKKPFYKFCVLIDFSPYVLAQDYKQTNRVVDKKVSHLTSSISSKASIYLRCSPLRTGPQPDIGSYELERPIIDDEDVLTANQNLQVAPLIV